MDPKDYKDTLHLPRTGFPMKANLPVREPEQVAAWEAMGIYEQVMKHTAQMPSFILHDGPPYANNHIHQGHVLNKVLKDIVVKQRSMTGHRAPFVPGWDCHGLPIELQVDKKLGKKKREMSTAQFRRECRAYAQKWMEIQRDEFKRLGVFGRWERPYLTMDYEYEAQIVRELARFAGKGQLYKGKKPVYWCIRDATALAEFEVEYEDHTSPSIYVRFDLNGDTSKLPESVQAKQPSLVIWTTTPWTLPANLAIAAGAKFEYVAYELNGRAVIVAKNLLHTFLTEVAPDELKLKEGRTAADSLRAVRGGPGGIGGAEGAGGTRAPHGPPDPKGGADSLRAARGGTGGIGGAQDARGGRAPHGPPDPMDNPVAALHDPSRILAHFTGADLAGLTYAHPFIERTSEVLLAEHVTLEQGTGLVHTAPGHGVEDYVLGLQVGLDIYNPVDDRGRYREDLPLESLRGVKVWDANPLILDLLADSGHLLSPKDLNVTHSYPHCWRCGQPVIFRATYQWFLGMEQNDLRKKALAEIDRVVWIPAWGRDRIHGMIEGRPDWCISRQRAWGVPIPVFYCTGCEHCVATEDAMNQVADVFEKEGADAWFERTPQELVPSLKCPDCGGTDFTKETDILDVWFDSGASYAAVCEKDPDLATPVQLYLEGSDQHRGWFHSTLLEAVGTRGHAPYEAVLTHGFVVDGEGKKLSKKKGNYTPVDKVLKQRGAEILRLWVAAEDYSSDIRYSDQILDRISDGYRKIRNTLRYALGNLGSFEPEKHRVPPEQWTDIDRWAWARFSSFVTRVTAAYEAYEFHTVYHATMDLVAVDLSAVYFDILKDRLYCSGADWPERRAAQSVLWDILVDFLRVLAPILSFTCEEAWQTLRREHPEAKLASSVFLAGWPEHREVESLPDFDRLLEIRSDVLGRLEQARRDKELGASLQAHVALTVSDDDLALLQRHEGFLPELFIVSSVSIAGGGDGVAAVVSRAEGEKCERCWAYRSLGSDASNPGLCERCTRAAAG